MGMSGNLDPMSIPFPSGRRVPNSLLEFYRNRKDEDEEKLADEPKFKLITNRGY